MSGWPRFADRLGGQVGLRRAGEVRWAADPAQGRVLARRVADAGVRVEVGDEELRPSTTVLAAGAEAVQVAAAVGLEVPTVASPGMLVETGPLAPLTDKVVYLPGGPGPPVHLRQRADGSVLVGERSQETVATDPGERHARRLLAQAARCWAGRPPPRSPRAPPAGCWPRSAPAASPSAPPGHAGGRVGVPRAAPGQDRST